MLESRDVVRPELLLLTFLGVHRHRRVDQTLFVHREEHRTVEAVVLAEDLGQHRHRLLAPVFLVGRDQHDVLALARALTAGVGEPLRVLRHRVGAGREDDAGEKGEETREHGEVGYLAGISLTV